MAQVLFPENIGSLSRTSATTISWPASIVNIGGQQYTTTAATILDITASGAGGIDTGSVAANTEYKIFAVYSAATVYLVASLSSAPTGFSQYEWIGRFTTDGSSEVWSVSNNAVDYDYEIEGSIGEVGIVDNDKGHLIDGLFPVINNVHYFDLEADANDDSGNASPQNLTNNGSTPFTGKGLFGDCALIGSGQWFSSGHTDFNPGDSDFSAGGWFKPDDWSTNMGFFGSWAGSGNWSWDVEIFSNTLQVYYSTTGAAALNIGGAMSNMGELEGWHHIAVTYTASSNTFKVYFDGHLVKTAVASGDIYTPGSPQFAIGGANSGNYYSGQASDVFMDKGNVLTDAQILAIASRRYQGPCLKAGHELTAASFPSHGDAAFYSLEDLTEGSVAVGGALSNNGSAVFTGIDMFGIDSNTLTLNGTNQWLSSADAHFNPGNKDFSVCGWFYQPQWYGTGSTRGFFGVWDGTNANKSFALMRHSTAGFYLIAYDTTTREYSTNADGFDWNYFTGWHHVVLTYTAATLTFDIYWDTVKVGTYTMTSALQTAGVNDFSLGQEGNGAYYWNDKIDEFAFVNGHVLTQEEIRKIYSYRANHDLYLEPKEQNWDGTITSPDGLYTSLDADHVIDKTRTDAYWTIEGPSEDSEVHIKMKKD